MTGDEERGADAVRTLLRRIDRPPPRVDVDLAVRTGRRGERRRQVLIVAAAAAGVVGVSGVAAVGIGGGHPPDRGGLGATPTAKPTPTVEPTPVSCTVTGFAKLPGHTVSMYAGDPTGRYQIGTAFNEARQKILGALWAGGRPTVFEVPGSGVFTDPTDVTSKGVVVGTASGVRDGGGFAWRYADGKVTKLPNPPGYSASGRAVVNERGDVAAVVATASTAYAVVVWPAASPNEPRVLSTPERPEVYDMADDGTVVGLVSEADHGTAYIGTPYVWSPDGIGRALAVPSTWDDGALEGVHGDWAFGSVHKRPSGFGPGTRSSTPNATRESRPASSDWTLAPARWRLSTGEVQVWTGPLANAMVYNATESGWLSVSMGREGSALVAPDGRVLGLKDRGKAGARLYQAAWVSDDGRTILGEAWYPSSGREEPATWRCD
jgi:hypothetical protein